MTSNRYKWLVVMMLWFVCLYNYADRQAIYSVFPVLKSQMHLTDRQLGIVGGAFMWLYALGLPLAGVLGDRFSRKKLVLGGLIFWSLITLATAMSTRYGQLVLFRALEGLGEAFYFPASMSLISDYHDTTTRSRAMSFHQSSVYAGTILGGAAAGFFAERWGWRSGFFIFGFQGLVLAVVLMLALDEPERTRDPTVPMDSGESAWQSLAGILRLPRVWTLIVVFIGANFVAAVFLTWLPTYLFQRFHMSLTMSGFTATAWLQLPAVVGVVAGGTMADAWAARRGSARMLSQALGLLAGAPFLYFVGWAPAVSMLLAALVGFGLCRGIYDSNLWASLHDEVEPRRRAVAVGVMNAMGWFGGGCAPYAIAAMSQHWGMGRCFSALSLIYLAVGLMLVAVALRRKGAESAPVAASRLGVAD